MQAQIRDAIVLARTGARERGIDRLIIEADSLGIEVGFPPFNNAFMADWIRANTASESYAARWLRKAQELESPSKASIETQGSLERIAVTESSEAFSAGRAAVLRDAGVTELLRVWDAESDACPVCQDADGQTVGYNESFSIGEPGEVHSYCRCGFTVIAVSRRG